MLYQDIVEAIFLSRENRFIAKVLIAGVEETVHVKNTGRCKELLLPGAVVILQRSGNPLRKTAYSLIAVYKGDRLINMDSQITPPVVREALEQGLVGEFPGITRVRSEVKFGESRFDLYFEQGDQRGFIEVKGVTLEQEGQVLFPDAPTIRGTRHVREMMSAVDQGYLGCIFFLIQMKGVSHFTPNQLMDPPFAQALREAAQRGVLILAYDCRVKPGEITLGERVEVRL
ncbi:MAG TPA: DNA/RNA nuclease SfsA [Bacillota bacterium]|nr:DNA/RNA nuclease SfsA [Bacillota bacterium]